MSPPPGQAPDLHDNDLDASLAMAQAALCVKNKAIDMLSQEVRSLRRENDDLFRAVVPAPAAEQQPQQQSQQQQEDDEVQRLRAELSAARQHIFSLEAELEDTMEAAMQLWETVQGGSYSDDGSPSRAGSLYQEQLMSPTTDYTDGDDAAGLMWRTPSAASPALGEGLSPRTAAPLLAGSLSPAPAAVTRLADLAARRPSSAAASPRLLSSRSAGSSAQAHTGIFTPIEARVTSLTNKLRGYMLRQPGSMSLSPAAVSPGRPGLHAEGGAKAAASTPSAAADIVTPRDVDV